MKKILMFCFTLFLLSGCAFHKQPFVTYKKDVPLSETSVVVTKENSGSGFAHIVQVNQNKTSCLQAGCPFWVRTLSGENTFEINYKIFNNGISSYLTGMKTITIPNMKPRHVYEIEFIPNEKELTFTTKVNDVGESPNYEYTTPLNGKFKVTF